MFNIFKKKPLRFCKDCKYVGAGTYPSCLHDEAIKDGHLSLISGKIEGNGSYSCYDMRSLWAYGICGKRAKYFEPKEGDDAK